MATFHDLLASYNGKTVSYNNATYVLSTVNNDYITLFHQIEPGVGTYYYIPFNGIARVDMHENHQATNIPIHTKVATP